ncbi:uncharacterized protein B0J16DRAFT_324592 [Fusarium flagelliforme]|uniref:uncharacterized protein n=1 Tax=Fusarium flagelliforme TaxID=2675880 RepID=UPI001E8EB782|nr:uncharacterized protein B0J16DRAFT_324592 [Fusarium flagelliforme]KAH7175152.1 hypothetical protein B0J16DRAFT_324592 [Fusarium flagelliforme]
MYLLFPHSKNRLRQILESAQTISGMTQGHEKSTIVRAATCGTQNPNLTLGLDDEEAASQGDALVSESEGHRDGQLDSDNTPKTNHHIRDLGKSKSHSKRRRHSMISQGFEAKQVKRQGPRKY